MPFDKNYKDWIKIDVSHLLSPNPDYRETNELFNRCRRYCHEHIEKGWWYNINYSRPQTIVFYIKNSEDALAFKITHG